MIIYLTAFSRRTAAAAPVQIDRALAGPSTQRATQGGYINGTAVADLRFRALPLVHLLIGIGVIAYSIVLLAVVAPRSAHLPETAL
jgi:hypothetical protein